MLGRIASEQRARESWEGGQREEELAEPEVRDDKQGFARYHAPEIRVIESDGSEDSPKLLRS